LPPANEFGAHLPKIPSPSKAGKAHFDQPHPISKIYPKFGLKTSMGRLARPSNRIQPVAPDDFFDLHAGQTNSLEFSGKVRSPQRMQTRLPGLRGATGFS